MTDNKEQNTEEQRAFGESFANFKRKTRRANALKRLDDADTAEINRLKETVALRAEVAALREQQAAWAESCARYVSEVLADLRTKVEALRDESHMADSPGLIWRSDVLALLDEEEVPHG